MEMSAQPQASATLPATKKLEVGWVPGQVRAPWERKNHLPSPGFTILCKIQQRFNRLYSHTLKPWVSAGQISVKHDKSTGG
jgi:hypothetical protein